MMKRLLDWVQGFALALGGPGLFLIAFLDSSILSFPEVNDLLIIWLTVQHPHRMVYYALLSTLGRSRVPHALPAGANGASDFLRKAGARTAPRSGDPGLRKYGLLSVLVPSLLRRRCLSRFSSSRRGCPYPHARLRGAVGIGGDPLLRTGSLLALWYGERPPHSSARTRRELPWNGRWWRWCSASAVGSGSVGRRPPEPVPRPTRARVDEINGSRLHQIVCVVPPKR